MGNISKETCDDNSIEGYSGLAVLIFVPILAGLITEKIVKK